LSAGEMLDGEVRYTVGADWAPRRRSLAENSLRSASPMRLTLVRDCAAGETGAVF